MTSTSGTESESTQDDWRTILVVDDSSMDRIRAGALVQKMGGWKVLNAQNGVEALEVLSENQPDLVLTDLMMPEMDGLQLVQNVCELHPQVPIILMTANGSEEIAIQALQNGAASYVPKRLLAHSLASTIEQVLNASRIDREEQKLFEYQSFWEAHFELENDPALVPPFVAYMEKHLSRLETCEQAGLVLMGVALHESLTNAIFHGNLEISSELRDTEEAKYYSLAEERREQEPYKDRRVHVTARISRQEATFVVRDEGQGFDPGTLPDPTDPTNLEKVSGRGLLLIRTFMDVVEHNAAGNSITMVKRRWSKT